MSVSSGFFNSNENHDRRYDAEEFGSIFDGILKDGVYSTIGQAFAVTASEGLFVQVDAGRAWFNHTWIYNDAPILLEIIEPPLYAKRYDAVVIEVNKTEEVRSTLIRVVNGLAASNPVKPTMVHTDSINQYPLAYILVEDGISEIDPSKIENTVGTDECPFCTGILEQISIEDLLANWGQEFEAALSGWETTAESDFEDWFQNLQDQLDDNQAAHLQHEIDDVWDYLNSIGRAEEEEF